MKIKLLFIGKENAGYFHDAITDYTHKLKYYISFESIAIPYLKSTKSWSPEELKSKEKDLLLKKIELTDYVVLLDESGIEMTSLRFSEFLARQQNIGTKNVTFIIGGIYGFAPEMYQRANFKLSLSQMTLPHILARLLFLEQLYRACTILKGEPYHHA